jgi:hypothetical protein
VKWESWDEKDNTWKPEDNMAKSKEVAKEYWKELCGQPKEKRKITQTKACEAGFFWMVERHSRVIFVFRSVCCVSSRAF